MSKTDTTPRYRDAVRKQFGYLAFALIAVGVAIGIGLGLGELFYRGHYGLAGVGVALAIASFIFGNAFFQWRDERRWSQRFGDQNGR